MSYRTLSAKPLNKSLKTLLRRTSHIGLGLGAFAPVLALANPTGGQVVAGQASITTPSANGLVVHQGSQSAIINWQQFNIGSGEYVTFQQPSSSSVVLNRVVGGSPTSILGNLNANGQVFLVNTNGVYFGHGASVDAQGFLASTLDINNSDFLAKNYLFNKSGNGSATVVNQGSITAHRGGYVVLAGDYASNEGVISAQSGHVVLAAGAKSTLTLQGNSLVSYVVNGATLSSLAGAANAGQLLADGGTVIMTADVANALKATVVNNTGLVEARRISKDSGNIFLTATGGNIVNAGTLNAQAMVTGQAGGNIVLKGDGVTNLTNTSKIVATGMGADGGHVELSGNVLNVRGTAALGRGGNLLLDPGTMSIDVTNPGTGSLNQNSAGTTGAGIGHMSVGFIQTQLNAGAAVNISAANRIEHAGSVHAITATTGAGNLGFKVGSNGHVDMGGVNITIKGNINATQMGYGSFGHLVAGAVDLEASHSLQLARAVENSHGVITKKSVVSTTGAVTLNGGSNGIRSAEGSGEAGIAIQAKTLAAIGAMSVGSNVNLAGKSIDVFGDIKAGGKVTAVASNGYATLQHVQAGHDVVIQATGGTLHAGSVDATSGNVAIVDKTANVTIGDATAGHGNVTVNTTGHTLSFSGEAGLFAPNGNILVLAANIGHTNVANEQLRINAGGTITLDGQIKLTGSKDLLEISGSGAIKVDHSILNADGTVEITGPTLAYTGGGKNFSISAGYGNLTLDAAIGSAHAPVTYNVNLKDGGYGLFIEKSIYAGHTAGGLAANITATETGHDGTGPTGVLVDNATSSGESATAAAAVVLNAAGTVTLKGYDVGVGGARGSIGAYGGAVGINAGANIILQATGTASGGGQIGVVANDANGSSAVVNHSITMTAGNTLVMTGNDISIKAGNVFAGASDHVASGAANVVLKAGNKVQLTAVNEVSIEGGSEAIASADADGPKVAGTATANAAVAIVAGNNLGITAHNIHVEAGYGAGRASASEGGIATATANTGVQLISTKGSIVLTGGSAEGGSITLHGGDYTGESGYGRAEGASQGAFSKAVATATGNVALTAAAGGISLTAQNVTLNAGYGAGLQHFSSVSHGDFDNVAVASDGAKASYTATADVNLTAGAAGITITGVDANLNGGGGQLNGASASAHSAAATVVTSGRVNLTAAGNVTFLEHGSVNIHAGYSNAAAMRAAASNSNEAAAKGITKVTSDGGIGITGANISVGSGGEGSLNININGGSDIASGALITGRAGSASVTGRSRVDLTATTGNITLSAAHNVNVQAGQDVGRASSLSAGSPAAGGKATLNVDGGVGLRAAKGSVTLAAGQTSSHGVTVAGGRAGNSADVSGYGSGVATLNALSSVSVVAGKNFKATAQYVSLEAGYGAASSDAVSAFSDAKAHVNANTSLNIKAAAVTVAAATGVTISAGSEAAEDVEMTAAGAGSASVNANNSVNITATGALRVTTGQGEVRVQGGNFEAGSAGISATGAGKATINANGSLNLKGASVVLSGLSGGLSIQGGREAAMAAHASAESSGQAVVNANAAVTITATAGNLGLGGKHFVQVAGGSRAAAGYDSGSSRSFSNFNAFNASSGSETVLRHAASVVNTEASALGSHAVATVTGNAATNLTATGNVTLSQTSAASGSLRAHGGDSAAALVLTNATAGGVATVNGTAGLHIKAGTSGTVTIGGHYVNLRGGHFVAGNGEWASSFRASYHSANHSDSFAQRDFTRFTLQPSHADFAGGAASKAVVNGDGTLTIQAGTVNVTAHGAKLGISGGFAAGSHAAVSASNGGHASVSGKAGVNIAAQAVNIQEVGVATSPSAGLFIGGGYHDAGGASVTGKNGGQAALNVDSSLTVTAANLSVTGNSAVEIYGGGHGSSFIASGEGRPISGGRGTEVTGSNGGSAQVNANAGVNIAVSQNFTMALAGTTSGFAVIRGGNDAGINSEVTGKQGTAALTVNDGVNVTAGGAITINTVKAKGANIGIQAGSYGGFAADISASGSSFTQAKATGTIANSVSLVAKGTVTINAGAGDVNLAAASNTPAGFQAQHAFVGASNGTANLTVNSGLTIAGPNVKVHAASYTTTSVGSAHHVTHHAGDVNIQTNQYAADAGSVSVGAGSGGSASLNVNHGVKLVTGGTLSLTATHDLTVGGSNHGVASSADVFADGAGAKAAAHVDESTLLQGNAAVTIAAGDEVTLGTVGDIGSQLSVEAGSGGNASFHGNAELNVVTKGAFSVKAGDEVFIATGDDGGEEAAASAFGPGAQASFVDDGNLNISAKTVAVSAGSYIEIGDTWGAGSEANAHASNGGNAALTSTRNVNLTAATALGLTLTGAAGTGSINISGYGAGYYAGASVENGGKASFTAHQDVNLNVTAAGGTLTLNAGNKHGGVVIDPANEAGSNGYAGAFGSGSASYNVTSNISLTAPGAVTILAPHGNISMHGSYETGEGMHANASHGGRATATVNGNLTVRGTAVKISAGSYTTTSSGASHHVTNHKGSVTLAAGGEEDGYEASVTAFAGAANATINNQLSIVATAGALSVKAAGELQVNAVTEYYNGESAGVTASYGGNASLTLNQTALLSGKTGVSLAGSTVYLDVNGSNDDNGASQHVFASHGGKAALTDNETLTIVATNGDVNVTAGSGGLAVQGANSFGYDGSATAKHLNAQATYTANGSLGIMGSHVNLTTKAGGDLTISGGEWAASDVQVHGSSGGSAAYNVVADVNITGRKGVKISAGSAEGITFDAGDDAGRGASVFAAFGGKAKLNTSANVNVSATSPGAAIAVTTLKTGEIFIGGGYNIGSEVSVSAIEAGSANLTANAGVNLHAAGALTITAADGLNIVGAQGNFAGGNSPGSGDHVTIAGAEAGRAIMTAQSLVNLTGSAVTLGAGSGSMDIIGGSGEGHLRFAQVRGSDSGSAQLNTVSAVNITATKGAVTATAAEGIFVDGGGAFMAEGAQVQASGSDANATLNGSETVNLSGGNISLTGQSVFVGAGFVTGLGLSVAAGNGTHSAHVANATANLNASVNINATGNVSLTGKGSTSNGSGSYGVRIQAGNDAGAEEAVSGYGSFAKAATNIVNDININAAGAFTAKASVSNLDILSGYGAGFAEVFAVDSASATQTVDTSVNIKAGGAMTLSGKTGVFVRAGSGLGTHAELIGLDGATAKQTLSANMNLAAGGSVNVTAASGSVSFAGGNSVGRRAGGPGGQVIRGMFDGTAVYTANAAVSLQAGGNLNVTAKDSIGILGGGGFSFSPVASYGGVAAVNANTSVTVKTGGKLTLTATTGDIAMRAGGDVKYKGDFSSVTTGSGSSGTAGRAIKANLNTAVDVEAVGSAAAVAGGNILISAGDGALMAVGKYRNKSFSAVGTNWMGGSASLNGNFGATLKTGKNLTLTAGGSLAIDALQGFGSTASVGNVLQVRGGSSEAHAKLNLNGNALVQAGGNIALSVADNMGLYAGSLGDVRADHVFGQSYVVTATANATLKAGGNITFTKVGGSLIVAGAGVNQSHSGLLLAEAAGLNSSGEGRVVVSENANALISAAGNIATTTAIGGDLSILGPSRVDGIVLGHTNNQTATVSGNVTVNAGGSVTLNVAGDIDIAGPASGGASVESFGTSAHLIDKVQAKTTVSAGGALSLTAGGNLIVAAGNGMKAVANPSASIGFATVLASGDASTTLRAGGNMTLNAAGNVQIRGGSDADASAKGFGGFNSFTAIANANANIIAGGNLSITAGSGATFQGGSNASGKAFTFGLGNTMTATGHADLNLTVGGNLTVAVTGPLNIYGGPLVEGLQGSSIAALADGSNNKATATATAKVNVTAGGNVAITATGGNLSIAGASSAASFRTVIAGSPSASTAAFNNTASVTADGSVNIKGKNVTLTATGGGVFVNAGAQNASRSVIAAAGSANTGTSTSPSIINGSHNRASLTVNSSVNVTATGAITVSGTAVSLAAAPSNSHTHITSGSFSSQATVKQISGVHLSAPTVHITPAPSITTFGSFNSSGYQFSGGVTTNVLTGGAGAHLIKVSGLSSAVHGSPTAFVAPVISMDLGKLQDLSLVTHLVTVLGDASIALIPMTHGFSVPVEHKDSLLGQRTTDFTPAGSGAGSR